MSLYSVDTVPIPLNVETYTGAKQEYTQILPQTEYIALTKCKYVPLMQAQISLFAKIGYMYYCECAHLLKKCTEHTCMSAIYYDQSSQIKVNKCKMMVTFDTLSESKILDASIILMLSNLQKPWTVFLSVGPEAKLDMFNNFDLDKPFDLHFDPSSAKHQPLCIIIQEGNDPILTNDFYLTNMEPQLWILPTPPTLAT